MATIKQPGDPTSRENDGSDLSRQDLGHGVAVFESEHGVWVVESSTVKLPWMKRRPGFPGTAVDWDGQLMEVADGSEESGRFVLAPWPPNEAVRTAFPLSREWVAGLFADDASTAEARRIRGLLVTLIPLTGLLPQRIQMRLERDFNFPAGRATTISALVEILLGAAATLQVLLLMTGSGWILPPALRWAVFFGPLLLFEAILRLYFTIGHGDPIGTFLLSWLNLFESETETGTVLESLRPVPVDWDPDGSALTLAVREARADWVENGILTYRGRSYRLVGRESSNFETRYRFTGTPAGTVSTLALVPPRPRTPPPRARSYGPLGLGLRSFLFAFAPARYQKTWFEHNGGSALGFTLVSACLELVAGGHGVATQPAGDLLVFVDLVTLGDGLYRLGAAVITRGPVGSLYGLPFQSFFRRWTAPRSP